MKFDRVRREFKKTLWGEELDNERYDNPAAPSLELDFLHQYEGKKYQCFQCNSRFEEDRIRITQLGPYCSTCFQRVFPKVEEG